MLLFVYEGLTHPDEDNTDYDLVWTEARSRTSQEVLLHVE